MEKGSSPTRAIQKWLLPAPVRASSATSISRNYDVFLSFRGGDTRKNFTDHLSLNARAKRNHWFLPIFYHVDPSDVRNQKGSFGDANQEKKEMVQKWRIALRKAANLCGCHVDDQHETEVVKEIVNTIIRRLNHQPLSVGKNIVGISVHLEKLKSLMNTNLNKVSVVGICGIGGAGKTTIAKAIYNEISYQYDGSSFLKNIRERSKGDILQLQQELLHDELKQLEYLAEEKDWFEAKSTIIITSRDKQVLAQYGVDISYEGTQAIEGLFLDRCKFNPSYLNRESFKEMNRLRLLKIRSPRRKLFLEDHLPRDFAFSSYELTYLYWDGYPSEYLPMNFHAKNLVELLLRTSNIKQLWRGNKLHEKLKVIDLSYSVHLIKIPDFSSVPNLEILTLEGCVNLELLPRGIYKLKHLQTLSFNGCSKLERFPEIKGNMGKLRVLDLSGTAIMDLPSSISHLNGLQTLLLEDCSKLHKIPIHICHLSSLEVLDLGNCNIMEGGIPSDICHLSSLQKLNLEGGHFSCIPATINQLSRLKALNLSHCNNLEQIPELPSSLRLLDAHGSNCTSSRAPFLPLHSLVNCFSWTKRRDGYLVTTELPHNWYQNNEFLGFAIYCVHVPLLDESEDIPEKESAHGSESESDDKSEDESAHTWENETDDKSVAGSFSKNEYEHTHSCSLKCSLSVHGGGVGMIDLSLFESNCFCYKEGKDEDNESVSGQMWVVCYSKAAIQEWFRSDQWTLIGTSFQDFYNNSEKALKVKECGVRLIYSQDLQQSHPLTIQTEDADVRICSECQQDATCRRKRCFKGSDMNEVPIMENPLELDSLCLRDCKNLTSLPSSIFGFKSLAALSCSGCSQLESFPEIVQDMESLIKLYLDGTAIREIPSSIQRLRGLQSLFLSQCKNLVNLPESICNLTSFKTLVVSRCPNFNKLPDNLGRLQSLEHLFIGYLDSMNFQLPSLSGLCSLRILMLQACNLREIPSEIYYLSSLVTLYLMGNHFSRIPDGISQLYNLKHFDLSHCKMLQHIPELPSGLTYLDAHHCTSLENLSSQSSLLWSSLFKCFKSQIQGVEVGAIVQTFIPQSNGIPEWISHQKSGFQITMELPWSWYENDDFLGFVLCSLHVPFDTDTAKHRSFNCKLNFDHDSASFLLDVIRFKQSCECCYDEDESNQGWLIYYSKSNIPKKYHSNEWRTLKASFYGHSSNRPGKVERCGFHFLYAHDYEHNNLTMCTSSFDGIFQAAKYIMSNAQPP
ncbi:TMV resistance protein N [Vitis vinifera]|uniref:ADP-ribosyl cyclase/cyclic ADP-ribose hydrolase n=1 Tax=Vitis vinifera TaxID=29760 RepID=A0A438IJD4_VITVI|nr:TMV resistance protein N [Vitis vinifera]